MMPMPVAPTPSYAVNPLASFYALNIVLILLIVTLGGAWTLARRRHRTVHDAPAPSVSARRLLTWGLGGLWLLDGLLQAQPFMVTSFVGGFLSPMLPGQPQFVARIVDLGMRLWSRDPLLANFAAAWLQIGIGVLILAGGASRWRRIGLMASVGWGLIVWAAGEAFGSLFSSGSWLSGSPGSALLYVVLAIVLLGPSTWWTSPHTAGVWRMFLAGLWTVAFVLQVWPHNAWWTARGLSTYVRAMAAMAQPRVFSAPLWAWSGLLQHHPILWNAGLAAGFLALALYWAFARPSLMGWGLTMLATFATWMMGQDFGVLGGMGTDPNSGIVVLLALVGYAVQVGWLPFATRRGQRRENRPLPPAAGRPPQPAHQRPTG